MLLKFDLIVIYEHLSELLGVNILYKEQMEVYVYRAKWFLKSEIIV